LPCIGNGSLKCLPYQLSMVGDLPTMVITGNWELGFDSEEGAWKIATTSKGGSRRENNSLVVRVVTTNTDSGLLLMLRVNSKSFHEDQLEGMSGASSHGNSSSNSVY
uniref:SHR-BD domain-containing protein n=1 Tax=Schistocephalus solidus TaxID=70667 RepID=A0A183TTJ3_SCHSO